MENSGWKFVFTVKWTAKNRQAEEKQGTEEMTIPLKAEEFNEAGNEARQILAEENLPNLLEQFKSLYFKGVEVFDLRIICSNPWLIETEVYLLEV